MRNILLTFAMVAISYCATAQSASIPFELANDSRQSIHLIIPGREVTEIKAKSTYELNLRKGQKIFFMYQGKQYTLLTVNEKLTDKMLDLNRMMLVKKQQIDYAIVSR